MALEISELMARYSNPGRVEKIFLRPARLVEPLPVEDAHIAVGGLVGDHGSAGKRAVTLIQAEHLPVIAALAGCADVDPALLRRNIVVSGLNLLAWRKSRLKIGDAVIEVIGPCPPCSRMENILGHGGYTAMRGHGGICGEVVEPGQIAVGSSVVPVAK